MCSRDRQHIYPNIRVVVTRLVHRSIPISYVLLNTKVARFIRFFSKSTVAHMHCGGPPRIRIGRPDYVHNVAYTYIYVCVGTVDKSRYLSKMHFNRLTFWALQLPRFHMCFWNAAVISRPYYYYLFVVRRPPLCQRGICLYHAYRLGEHLFVRVYKY